MKDLVSIRSEIDGVVEFFQIKMNKLKKVLLPGGLIFVINSKDKKSVFKYKLNEPIKYSLTSKLAYTLHYKHGEEVEENDSILSINSEIEGEVSVKKNKIIVTKKTITKEYTIDKNFIVLVNDGDKVKVGQTLAKLPSPFYGIVKYTFTPESLETEKNWKITEITVLQNAVSYEIPDEFKIKVANGAEIKAGTVIAEGIIREEYEMAIENSFDEEEKEEGFISDEESEESDEETNGDFDYEEEPLDSEFEDDENGDDFLEDVDDFTPKKKL